MNSFNILKTMKTLSLEIDDKNYQTILSFIKLIPNCQIIEEDELSETEHKHIKKNGHIHNGKQSYACCNCGRQFVKFPENIIISNETKALIDKLLLVSLNFDNTSIP